MHESKFRVGDRVRYSDRTIQQSYQFWLERMVNGSPWGVVSGAKKTYERERDERGTITWAGWNGYCLAVHVQWDNGVTSQCMEGTVTKVEPSQEFMEALK